MLESDTEIDLLLEGDVLNHLIINEEKLCHKRCNIHKFILF